MQCSRKSYAAQYVLAAALLLTASSGAWAGSQDPSGAWNNSWDFQDSNSAQYNLNLATSVYNVRKGHGLTPIYNSYGYSYNYGTMNSISNGSTNVVNATSTSVDAHGAQDSMVTVSTDQSSNTADQSANSKSVTVYDGGPH